ncbi:extracellular mutant protein 11-domain-containing protein [Lineolata rhizophorae]|uniref:Extracellular mutant protein 11-domain-containing protein n=1 Tax=Lineolata rhizophorae TaxID=578093 RepID=A0A6A6NTF2_9PEZI|nr:extracellular mutant protein 11-domain-containing protein [Lineolata rhizophorae]
MDPPKRLHNFVNRRNSPNVPHRTATPRADRDDFAKLKVPVPDVNKSPGKDNDQFQDQTVRVSQIVENAGQSRDVFDTDPSNADTTTISTVQVPDSQPRERNNIQRENVEAPGYVEDEDEGQKHDDQEDGVALIIKKEIVEETQFDEAKSDRHFQLSDSKNSGVAATSQVAQGRSQVAVYANEMAQQGPLRLGPDDSFGAGESYPETTSGNVSEDIKDTKEAAHPRTFAASSRQQQSQQPITTNNQAVDTSSQVRQLPTRGQSLADQTRVLPRPKSAHGVARASGGFAQPRAPVPQRPAQPKHWAATQPDAMRMPLSDIPESEAQYPDGPEQDEFEPDYHYDDFGNVAYDELRNEPFDPVKRKFDQTPNQAQQQEPSSLPLGERLEQHRRAEPKQQKELWASLSLDEWEDAGEWFVEQFGVVVKKMASARRDKRRTATAFEEEVHRRYETVKVKRTQIDEALERIRENGMNLFPGTPGKGTPGMSTSGRGKRIAD